MKKLILLLALIASAATAQAQRADGNQGYRGFFEVGHIFGHQKNEEIRRRPDDTTSYFVDKFDYSSSIFFSTTHGYQFSPQVFIGGGLGVQLWKARWSRHDPFSNSSSAINDYIAMTLWSGFVEARFDFPSASRISFFETNKIGVAGGEGIGGVKLYFAPAVGAKYQINYSLGLNLSLGYQIGQKATRHQQWHDIIYNYNLPLRGPTLSLGIDFQP